MAQSTSILGPYDGLTTADKIIVSGAVPHDVKERLFSIFLPRRGAVDKIITRSIYMVDAYLAQHPELYEHDEETREEIIHNLFNEFIRALQSLDPTKLIPSSPTITPNPTKPPTPHVQSML